MQMTNFLMLAIGCMLVGASQTKGMIPEFWCGSVLCVGIIIIVWSIIWDK